MAHQQHQGPTMKKLLFAGGLQRQGAGTGPKGSQPCCQRGKLSLGLIPGVLTRRKAEISLCI